MISRLTELVARLSAVWVDWMVDISGQLVVLFLGLLLVEWCCRPRWAALRYSLWTLVLVRLVVPPGFSLPTGWGWWVSSFEPASSVGSVATASPVLSWGAILMLCWAMISAALLILYRRSMRRVAKVVARGRPTRDPVLWQLFIDCRHRLGIRHPVELRHSVECTTPLVAGIRHPVILLPQRLLERLDERELESVLLHELGHVRRCDPVVNAVQGVLGCLYFFHPLVWWANAAIRRSREEACDELTLAVLAGYRKAYGSALLKAVELVDVPTPLTTLGMIRGNHPIKQRLLRILNPGLHFRRRSAWSRLLVVAALALVLLPAGRRPRTRAPEPTDRHRPTQILHAPDEPGDGTPFRVRKRLVY